MRSGTLVSRLKPLLETSDDSYQEPCRVISEDGSIIVGLDIQHSLLMPDQVTAAARYRGELSGSEAIGRFAFFADSPAISVNQNAELLDRNSVDNIAIGLLALACHIYPYVHPGYGWVDEWGWNLPEGKVLAAPRPKYLFWANFFGPEGVKSIGREFLEGAPGWSCVDLGGGGLLYVATESYQYWWENDHPELISYFRRKVPKIQIYRAQPIP